jgi:hypothetical protein
MDSRRPEKKSQLDYTSKNPLFQRGFFLKIIKNRVEKYIHNIYYVYRRWGE